MTTSWHARGLLFENCSCQLVCPGHIHFEQLCTHERCQGYWAFRFDEGSVGEVSLAGRRAVIAFDSPQRMVDGGWTQVLLVDDSATDAQTESLDAVFRGDLGGPWEILGGFVATRAPTRRVPIEFDGDEASKSVRIPGVLDSTVERIRGRDRGAPVTFENIFNQIHSSSQVLAFGASSFDDGAIRFDNEKTHGLWSAFEWTVASG